MRTYTRPVRPFISKAAAARRLGLSRPALYQQIKLGLIPIDGQGKIPRAAFEVVAAHCVRPAPVRAMTDHIDIEEFRGGFRIEGGPAAERAFACLQQAARKLDIQVTQEGQTLHLPTDENLVLRLLAEATRLLSEANGGAS